VDWKLVAAQIKAFDDRRALVKAMRGAIRRPLPEIRRAIKDKARSSMPHRGGLNVWVAGIRVNAAVQVNSRRVRMRVRGGRNSAGSRSDIKAIDRGRVRAPAWGRRGEGDWHTQSVPPGFFTFPARDHADDVLRAIDEAVDIALDQLRG
jgi:hypothetical protein